MPSEIEIDTIINTDRSDLGVRQLSKSLRDLISLQNKISTGSDQFHKLEAAITETESKIRDLKDGFVTLRGSGVERLTGSIGLLREGFLNADPEKLSVGMQGLGAAMKAIPIFLLIEGFKLLIDNIDKITEYFSESAQAAKENQKALEDLTIAVDINRVQTNALIQAKEEELTVLERQGVGLDKIISKIKEIDALKQDNFRGELQKTDKELNNELQKLAQLKSDLENATATESILQFFGFNVGATEKDIRDQEALIAKAQIKRGEITNNQAASDISTDAKINAAKDAANAKFLAAMKARIEAFQAFIKEKSQQEIDIETDRINIENRLHEEEIARAVKQIEEDKALRLYLAQATADQERQIADDNENKRRVASENAIAFDQALQVNTTEQKIDYINQERDTQLLNEALTQQQRIAIIEKAESDIFQIKLKNAQAYGTIAEQGAASLQALSDTVFEIQFANLKKGSVEEDKAARQRFKINKGLQLANAAIQGYQAVLAAFSAGAAIPIGGIVAGPAFAAVAAGVAIANIAKIAATQYTSSDAYNANQSAAGGGGDASAASSVSSNSSVSPQPTFNPQAVGGGFKTNSDKSDAEREADKKVYVLEGDIRNVMGKVDVYESRSTFGG